MNSYRENSKEYTTETRERSQYKYGDYTARNEYASENSNSNQIDDFDSLLYFAPKEARNENISVPAPKAKTFVETDDTMPSATTMQYKSQETSSDDFEFHTNRDVVLYDFESNREVEDDKQYRISTKGKVLIAVYTLVVITIFALIAINTRLLNNMNNDVAEMQTQVEALKEQGNQLRAELELVSSDAEIERKAAELGMLK